MNRLSHRKHAWLRGFAVLFSLTVVILMLPLRAQADVLAWPEWTLDEDEDETAHAQAAIVMDADTGAVLYENNADETHYPASITKIMTALVALENCSLDEIVTFSEDAVYKTEGSSIARDVGEQMTMEDCLYGMMLASANECAYAIGEHVAGGSIDDFVDMMNEKAAELGCTGTHFANSSGLPDEDHYVTARDMALIAKAAYENETFRTIVGTSYYEIAPTNKHDEITYLMNHHNMLCAYSSTKYLKDYCLGGKTGYTEAARNTLVTYAEQDGMTLICVVLDCDQTYQYQDTISLLEFCFEQFESVTATVESGLEDLFFDTDIAALQASASFVEVTDETLDVILPAGADASDVICELLADETGQTAGTVELVYNGKVVGTSSIEWAEVSASGWMQIAALSGTASDDTETTVSMDEASLGEAAVILALLAILAVLVTVIVKLRQRRERRRDERRAARLGADAAGQEAARAQRRSVQDAAPKKKRKKKKQQKKRSTRTDGKNRSSDGKKRSR